MRPKRSPGGVRERLRALLRAEDGPLTRELVRAPGRFGLGQLPVGRAPDSVTTLVCGFCSTGCGLLAHRRHGEAVGLSPAPDHPVNRGAACPKGWEALAPLDAPDRATTPLLRDAHGRLAPVDWPTALAAFASRFGALLARHGGDACAFLGTGQIPSEELLFLGALARFGLGFAHGDGNTRQCMATAASAYKESFGFDAPPFCYDDLEQSDVIVLVGSNLCIAHPILWERIRRNPHAPKIVVVDPRRTETACAATHHYAIAPKSDLAFFLSVAHVLIRRGWIDRGFVEAHTEGYEAFVALAADFAPARVAREVGLAAERIEELAALIHAGRRVSFWWTMGVNQGHQAVRVAQLLIDLALLTGQIGRPGTGANSITGQCNAMGSRMFSNTASLFCGRDFANAGDRREVAEILGIPFARVPEQGGLAYDQIVDGILAGRIKGLWVVATNGAHSWIEQQRFADALDRLEFLVVQDLYATTETARRAHLLLPAAGWGEKDGTFVNSERRVGLIRKVRRAPGQALADFQIFRLIAEAFGLEHPFASWKSPEDVFHVMRSLSRGRLCDITGIRGYAQLEEQGGIQWPLSASEARGTSSEARDTVSEARDAAAGDVPRGEGRRLFADGRFARPNGRALFVAARPEPVPEPPDAQYPLILLTGRGSASQWHTGTRTAKSGVLRKLHREGAWLELSPRDAAALGIENEAPVVVRSRRGSWYALARVCASLQPGQVFAPMHDPGVNRLTRQVVDPISRQPSYKHCAVRVEPDERQR